MADYTYTVTVASSVFVLDSESQAEIALGHDLTYRFDLSNSTNSGHTFRFSTTIDASGGQYETGYTTSTPSPGSADAYVELAVTSSTPATLYYYCSVHDSMGAKVVTTGNSYVETANLGAKIPVTGDAEDVWASHLNAGIRKMDSQLQPLQTTDTPTFATPTADGHAAIKSYVDAVETDVDKIHTNIALLGFKIAVNHTLVKYNLQDQIIDEFVVDEDDDDTGIDKDESEDVIWDSGYYKGSSGAVINHNANATNTFGDYTWYKYTTSGTVQFRTDTAQNYDYIVVAGGGGGGGFGGGGAGGFRTAASFPVAADTDIPVTVGAGGVGDDDGKGSNGDPSVFGTISSNGGGGGGMFSNTLQDGEDGGSGGGGGTNASPWPYDFGEGGEGVYDGVTLGSATWQGRDGGGEGSGGVGGNSACGGGGATTEGSIGTDGFGGAGGNGAKTAMGMDAADTTLFLADTDLEAGVVESADGGARYFSGGGGGTGSMMTSDNGGYGGGGMGKGTASYPALAGTDGTGGGGGGGYFTTGGKGGDGIVIIRAQSLEVVAGIVLQSKDTTAEAVPTHADMVMLIEDYVGTASLDISSGNIKVYISRDSGATTNDSWTQATLVDEGDWAGTTKRIIVAHDVSLTGKNSGTAMCYKITTHNQSASLKTRIHATSLGWR